MGHHVVDVGGDSVVVEVFGGGGGDVLVVIQDQTYRLRVCDGGYYLMVKIGRQLHTLRGSFDQILRAAVRVHRVWRDYDRIVQQAKLGAQRRRDAKLRDVFEWLTKEVEKDDTLGGGPA